MTDTAQGELRDTGARFEMDEQGLTSYADYRLADEGAGEGTVGGRLYIDYVFSPPPLRGSGASGRLMKAVADEARRRGLSITPICGYAAAWLRRSPEHRDLVA